MNDFVSGVRSDFVRDVAQIKRRLTNGELHAHERAIKDGLTQCAVHPERAYREDVTAILGELCYPLGTYCDCPAIWLQPCADSELACELMSLGAVLQKHAPRKTASIWASVRMDVRRYVIWFALEPEPEEGIPYEAAA